MKMLPTEVQGYIRHILHMIGMMLVAKGGLDQSMLEVYVGGLVNLISLSWFILISALPMIKGIRARFKRNRGRRHDDVDTTS